MGVEQAGGCRHRGAPPKAVVAQVVKIIQTIGEDGAYLNSYGLLPEEFRLAVPVAIEQMRGRSLASNKERRNFLTLIFDHLVSCRAIDRYTMPNYGRETVYRLSVPDIGDVAIVQKCCPDGKYSSVTRHEPMTARRSPRHGHPCVWLPPRTGKPPDPALDRTSGPPPLRIWHGHRFCPGHLAASSRPDRCPPCGYFPHRPALLPCSGAQLNVLVGPAAHDRQKRVHNGSVSVTARVPSRPARCG